MKDDDGLEPLPPSLARTWGDTTTGSLERYLRRSCRSPATYPQPNEMSTMSTSASTNKPKSSELK